jgi:hypothetical protein
VIDNRSLDTISAAASAIQRILGVSMALFLCCSSIGWGEEKVKAKLYLVPSIAPRYSDLLSPE